MEDRNRTVLRVATAIVELQIEFIKNGIEYLKPMVLRDVAELTGFHESTISRVSKGKTIHTPYGLFAFSYLFSTRIKAGKYSEVVSARVAKHRIKTMISMEDSVKPFSDETISKMLNKSGIQIVRRTVSKYREELKIPSMHLRRRL